MTGGLDINSELETPEYKAEYNKHLDIQNSLIRCLAFSFMNCSRNEELSNKLFFLSVIDDILQSSVAIKMLATEGVRNTCRRELRYLIELSMKSCYVSQKYSSKTIEEQIKEYKKDLKSTDISMVNNINLFYLSQASKESFSEEFKRIYGHTCNYVHATPVQMQERILLATQGRTIGLEGLNELKELNEELAKVYSFVLVLLFHSIPQWCVGDYLVESDGSTIEWFFTKSKYIAEIDETFDYKHERQSKIQEITDKRNKELNFRYIVNLLF